MKPVALTGPLRAGKDSVADILVSKYGYTRFAFGDELKDDFHRRYPEIPRDPKPRIGYQNHGQLMRALIDDDVWVRKCFENIEQQRFYCDIFPWNFGYKPFLPVITDCRQPNEFSRCRSAGFVIIRVTAPEGVRINRAVDAADTFSLRDLSHETEQHWRTFDADFEIVNDGTLADLERKIDDTMTNIIGGVK